VLQEPAFYVANPAMVEGRSDAPVTIVEFFDYHCHACYLAYPVLQRYVKSHPEVRLVLRPVAILGPTSVLAARAAVAAIKQGSFSQLTHELMAVAPALTQDSALLIARHMGLNLRRLESDMNSAFVSKILDENARLAQRIQLKGTPTYVLAQTHWSSAGALQSVGRAYEVPGVMDESTLNRWVGRLQT
jgi:protein-disulfide isomerase